MSNAASGRLERGCVWMWLASVGLFIGARVALAQTPAPPQLEQTVFVTATVAPLPSSWLSRSAATIERGDLTALGLDSPIEALRLSPGVDARARGPRDVQTDFSIRGATFGQSLILVDGVRMNNSQSGHHNGEIPLPVTAVDRIEVVSGAGSATHGADALGGTINIISRKGQYADALATVGQHGYAAGQASLSMANWPAHLTVTSWGARSSGFMIDRDFALGGVAVRLTPASPITIDIRHQRRAFGANGFYGASLSKEWTDQTMASVAWQRATTKWVTSARGTFRNHGDHFRWDILRPGVAENRHHTNAGDVSFIAERLIATSTRITIGAAAGTDRVRSTNLGNHDYSRGGVFAELQQPLGAHAMLQGGLRLDDYSSFGHSWSPSVSGSYWLNPRLRVRGSVAHAFRVPTFTELYYSDPGNLGTPDLRAERGWSADAGLDWTYEGWSISAGPFRRWDRDVIDWVKAAPADLWRSTNVRDVTATGVEVSASRRWKSALLSGSFTKLDVDAPALTLLSKYVLEYATEQVGASIAIPLPGRWRVAMNADYRHRLDGQRYTLGGLRVARSVKRAEVFVDATNVFDEDYHEVAGVAMPGRWVTAGVRLH